MLEARDRVGGRTWSRTLPNGALIEMGAEFILPGNTEVERLAHELGLGVWDKGMRYGKREPRGGVGMTDAELADGVAAVGAALAALEGRPSARELLDSLPIAPGAREAILARLEISSASRADDVPAIDMDGLAHIDDEPAPSVAGGNQGLALGLAGRLPVPVALGDPVEAVDWDSTGGCGCGPPAAGRVEADGCVVAVPAASSAAFASCPSSRRPSARRSPGCATATPPSSSCRWPSRPRRAPS